MSPGPRAKQKLKVWITVRTYPIPSRKYDGLVCTAGVTETGDFVRLYPINFRDLPFSQQYKKSNGSRSSRRNTEVATFAKRVTGQTATP
jgi:hypothetical protein